MHSAVVSNRIIRNALQLRIKRESSRTEQFVLLILLTVNKMSFTCPQWWILVHAAACKCLDELQVVHKHFTWPSQPPGLLQRGSESNMCSQLMSQKQFVAGYHAGHVHSPCQTKRCTKAHGGMEG